jgi:hypothetical protein
VIAQIQFHRTPELKVIKMKVETFTDLISSIAGVPNFLFIIFGYLVSKFQRFYSGFEMYQTFYRHDKKNDNSNNIWEEELDRECSEKEGPPKLRRRRGSSFFSIDQGKYRFGISLYERMMIYVSCTST